MQEAESAQQKESASGHDVSKLHWFKRQDNATGLSL